MASFSERTAILVDGGFYRLQAKKLFGDKTPEERADELFSYCIRHLNKGSAGYRRKRGALDGVSWV